jgi:hypothetical protein
MRSIVLRGASRPLLAAFGISCLFVAACTAQAGAPEYTSSAHSDITKGVRGDINGDGRADIALAGGIIPSSGNAWNTLPVAFSNGNGTFAVTNDAISEFSTYAVQGGAEALVGDFNGDGLADLALTGGHIPSSGAPWNTIPVAFSNGNGTFRVTNDAVSGFPVYATQTSTKPVVGDFNNDGLDDIALAGGPGWNTIPVAFSNGDGTFRVTNTYNASFPVYAVQQGAQLVAADFNGDGRSDLALTGGETLEPAQPGQIFGSYVPWNTLPVAFSNGDGSFDVTNSAITSFATYATQGALAVAGDFNGDGYGDVALSGGKTPSSGAPWSTVPVAFGNGNGTFRVTNDGVSGFPVYATQQGAQLVAGDYNGDGKTDLALTGGVGWSTVPVALSSGTGTFTVSNDGVSSFPAYAQQSTETQQVMAASASQARWPLPPILQ